MASLSQARHSGAGKSIFATPAHFRRAAHHRVPPSKPRRKRWTQHCRFTPVFRSNPAATCHADCGWWLGRRGARPLLVEGRIGMTRSLLDWTRTRGVKAVQLLVSASSFRRGLVRHAVMSRSTKVLAVAKISRCACAAPGKEAMVGANLGMASGDLGSWPVLVDGGLLQLAALVRAGLGARVRSGQPMDAVGFISMMRSTFLRSHFVIFDSAVMVNACSAADQTCNSRSKPRVATFAGPLVARDSGSVLARGT